LGSELWNLGMMDCPSYNGEWYTAVEITIPTTICGSDEAVKAAQKATQADVVQRLTQALEAVKPNIVLQPADHRAEICIEFCPADRNHLCRDFPHFGMCSRGCTCRWAHAMIETFMINFILAPLDGTEVAQPEPITPKTTVRWQPGRAPMPTPQEIALTPCKYSKAEDSRISEPIKLLAVGRRPKNPRPVAKKSWADISDESDDDADLLTFS